jgi:hypothetical protein
MRGSSTEAGLRYHGKAIVPGAQTVRRARPGRCAICVAADTHWLLEMLGLFRKGPAHNWAPPCKSNCAPGRFLNRAKQIFESQMPGG